DLMQQLEVTHSRRLPDGIPNEIELAESSLPSQVLPRTHVPGGDPQLIFKNENFHAVAPRYTTRNRRVDHRNLCRPQSVAHRGKRNRSRSLRGPPESALESRACSLSWSARTN